MLLSIAHVIELDMGLPFRIDIACFWWSNQVLSVVADRTACLASFFQKNVEKQAKFLNEWFAIDLLKTQKVPFWSGCSESYWRNCIR